MVHPVMPPRLHWGGLQLCEVVGMRISTSSPEAMPGCISSGERLEWEGDGWTGAVVSMFCCGDESKAEAIDSCPSLPHLQPWVDLYLG